jgi:hypothetical protein
VLDPLSEVCELVDLQTPVGDFLDAATRIQGLDLVITVDTAMAHLAGALGVLCWVMLPAHWTDWMRGRADCAWYPSLKLYRQEVAGIGGRWWRGWLGIWLGGEESLAGQKRRNSGFFGATCRRSGDVLAP